MTNFERIIRAIDELGPLTVADLEIQTGVDRLQLRSSVNTAMKRGYLQAVKPKKEPGVKTYAQTSYAATTREYKPRRQGYRVPVLWHAEDGTSVLFPSVNELARSFSVANGHAWACAKNNWRFRGGRLQLLESVSNAA
jgi:hypothetical protein